LRTLVEVIKAKKQAVSDAEIVIKKLEHKIQALVEEPTGHVTAAINLKKRYERIVKDSQ